MYPETISICNKGLGLRTQDAEKILKLATGKISMQEAGTNSKIPVPASKVSYSWNHLKNIQVSFVF